MTVLTLSNTDIYNVFGLVDSMDDDGPKDLVIDELLHDKDAVRWNQSHDAEL